HDGYLTLDEMHAMHANRGNAMQSGMQAGHDHEAGASANAAAGKPAMAGMGHDDQMPASGGMHHDMMDDRFKSMDADGDGRLSAAEHAAGAAKMFTTADTNQDGSVSRAEFDAAHASMMGDHMHEEGMHEDKDHDHDRDDQPAHP
ncbi:MAG TPA: hypothetical protein VLM17_01225, partial [Xanthomonadaceae bacterium]|nr:hypothetical protein [Xanthomonadaceae bacterium]